MRKYFTLIVVTVFAMAMFMTSCQPSDFAIEVHEDNTVTITAENAGDDMSSSAGTLEIADGDEIVITPALEKGVITVEFLDASGFDDPDEVPDVNNLEAVATITVSGSVEDVVGVKAGSYMVRATGGDKATGTVEITVRTAG